MTDIETTLRAMEERCEAATPDVRANGDFIAHSRTDLPRLIAAARELHEAFGNAMEYNAKGDTFNTRFALHIGRRKAADALTGNSETTGTESER
jgi:hypothetical protein